MLVSLAIIVLISIVAAHACSTDNGGTVYLSPAMRCELDSRNADQLYACRRAAGLTDIDHTSNNHN